MNKEEIKKEWQRILSEYKEARNKYENYVNQFFDKIINEDGIQETKKSLTREHLNEIIKLREEMNKKSKAFWDFANSVVFPES